MKHFIKVLTTLLIIISGLLGSIAMAEFAAEWVIQTHNSYKEGTVFSSIYPDGNSISVDSDGNIYTVGSFKNGTAGTGIDIGGTAFVSSGSFDGFLSKFDEGGNALWVKKIGGTNYDRLQSVVVDDNDDVYVMGYFASSADIFGTTLTSGGGYDIFVAKLNSSGTLQWLKQSSGSSSEHAYKLSVDSLGNVYLVGYIYSSTTLFGEIVTSSGSEDIFVVKLNAVNGNTTWVKTAGGSGYDRGQGIAADGLGNVYVTGYFDDTADIFGTSLTSDTDYYDIFVAKLDSSGDALWVKQAGGSTLYDKGYDLGVDSDNNVYIAGTYGNTADLFGISKTSHNYSDTFIAKLDTLGNTIWVKAAGGTSASSINSLFIDERNNIYATGKFYGNTLFYGVPLINSGSSDIYIVKLKGSTGDSLLVKSSGGSSSELGNTVVGDNKGRLYLIGKFKSTSVNIFGTILGTAGTTQQNEDYFIAKFKGITTSATTTVAAGGYHSCYVLDDGTVKCWGRNKYGQLGDNTVARRKTPVSVVGLEDVERLALGKVHSCALLTGGTVECWGRNKYGQLGNNTLVNSGTPVGVSNLTNVTQLVSGYQHNCALIEGGTVKCWGWNKYGQLGNGNRTNKTVPANVNLTGVVELSAGRVHTCALLIDNTVKCWGRNNYGQIGDGTTFLRKRPTLVSGLTSVSNIDLGGYHSCALLMGGTVKCWGRNNYGQLGDGTTTTKTTPIAVNELIEINSISMGHVSSCAVRSNQTTYCWGKNNYGQLGNGTTTNSSIAMNVSGMTDTEHISMGYQHTGVFTDSFEIKYWGYNRYGQLGDGTTANKLVPTEISE